MSPARSPATPDAIREAARELFPRDGYARTSVRDIAAAAGVDPALVIRHFGSKENLFLEVLGADSAALEAALAPGPEIPHDRLGRRMIADLIDADGEVRDVFLALLRASDSGEVHSRLRAAHDAAFVAPLTRRLEGPDAELRARLAASVVAGMLYSLWVVSDEAVAHLDRDELIARYGDLVQAALDGA